MKRPDDRIDLSPFDPEGDPERLNRVVSRVLERLGPGIVAEDPSFIDELSHFIARRYRAVCAAAAILILVAFAAGRSEPPRAAPGLDVPAEWAVWLATGEPPPAEALLLMVSSEGRENE